MPFLAITGNWDGPEENIGFADSYAATLGRNMNSYLIMTVSLRRTSLHLPRPIHQTLCLFTFTVSKIGRAQKKATKRPDMQPPRRNIVCLLLQASLPASLIWQGRHDQRRT